MKTVLLTIAILFSAQAQAGFTHRATITSTGGVSAKTGAAALGYGMPISIVCYQAARVQTGPQATVTATATSMFVEAGQAPRDFDLSSTENGVAIIPFSGTATTTCDVWERTGKLVFERLPSEPRLGLEPPPAVALRWDWAGARRRLEA